MSNVINIFSKIILLLILSKAIVMLIPKQLRIILNSIFKFTCYCINIIYNGFVNYTKNNNISKNKNNVIYLNKYKKIN